MLAPSDGRGFDTNGFHSGLTSVGWTTIDDGCKATGQGHLHKTAAIDRTLAGWSMEERTVTKRCGDYMMIICIDGVIGPRKYEGKREE